MADIPGLVRARPKSIRIREIWNTSSTLGTHSVHKFEPSVAIEAEVAVPLDNPQCMPPEAWEDIPAAARAPAYSGRIGILALVSSERQQARGGGRHAPLVATDDAIHSQDERWAAFPADLPVGLLAAEFTASSDARVGQEATIRLETSALRGDLRPIETAALLSTNVETSVLLSQLIKREVGRELAADLAGWLAARLRRPEPERGEYRLLLHTSIRAEIAGDNPITLKSFTIEWPQASDGSDVRLSVAKPVKFGSEVFIGDEYGDHRLSYNSGLGRLEIGNIKEIPLAPPVDGMQSFGIILRFASAELTQMHHLKAEMELEFAGSILGVSPLFSDWSGSIIGGNVSSPKVEVAQTTHAKTRMTINTKEIFNNQYHAFRYRLRLRGVVVDNERLQYVKQVLAERNMTLRAEGLGKGPEPGGRGGEWLLMADRPVQGDNLRLTTLVQCETRQVHLTEGTEAYRRQSQAIGADTTIDVLGILRGKREDLMREVNAYVRDLRHKLGIFASLR